MNDYGFGNRIFKLRTKFNLSQSELGNMVGVSNKAVSKWEMGVSKPTMNVLNKLATIFNVSLNDLLEEQKKHHITKIVVTGGPCAGKSTAQSWIQNEFTDRGYQVIFVKETATELITSGINGDTLSSIKDFQKCILKLQLEKEKIAFEAASKMKCDKVLIVCDRGALDGKGYIDEFGFNQIMNELNTNEVELRDNYDAIFHLNTAAKGASEFYTLENNEARKESVEEAVLKDDQIIEAYTGHPHLRVIDNSTDFKGKMRKLIAEIAAFLGEPVPYEIERKYLIEYPDIDKLIKMKNCKKVEIIQTYLNCDNEDEEVRIRQRGIDGNYTYYKTTKKKVSALKRIEVEKRLSKEEYISLLMNADSSLKQVRKDRYCLSMDNQYYEIDVFPFWKDKAIMEIELKDEEEKVKIPSFIKVIKEVTDDEDYKNHSFAKR